MILPLFPRVAHFAGSATADDDLILHADAQRRLLRVNCRVFEKADGINVAIGRGPGGRILSELRPPWNRSLGGATQRAAQIWVGQRERVFERWLGPRDVLYGEWLWHRLSVGYDRLPDLVLLFAWRRGMSWMGHKALLRRCQHEGLHCAPLLWTGRPASVDKIRSLVTRSRLGPRRSEGLVVERCTSGPGPRWGKWVDPAYRAVAPGRLSGRHNTLAPDAARAIPF